MVQYHRQHVFVKRKGKRMGVWTKETHRIIYCVAFIFPAVSI